MLANILVAPGDGVLLTDPAYPCVRNFIYMQSAVPQLIPDSMYQKKKPTDDQLKQNKTDKTQKQIIP